MTAMMRCGSFLALVASMTTTSFVHSFTTSSSIAHQGQRLAPSSIMMKSDSMTDATPIISGGGRRRQVLQQGLLALLTATTVPLPALAADSNAPTPEELKRIQLGYKQIQYLLKNFEQETTVCRENGGECKRDADPVRKALGLRSTTDNLFQIEKVFKKVKNMDLDPDKLEAFFEASEDWNSCVTMSNSMSFISQFGEYNPGGGKDEVLKYLEEARKQVILAESALKTIADCLDVPVDT